MNSRYDRDNDLQDHHDTGEQDREISLGTTTILGIFFALALLCAVFFGFGYSLGKHSVQPVAGASEAAEGLDSNSSKPAPGSALNPGRNSPSATPQPDSASQAESRQEDSSADAGDGSRQETAPAPVKVVVPPAPREARVAPAAKQTAATMPVTSAVTGPGSPVVQVAAVSHQGDADVLAAALKRRGYSVSIRRLPQDKLLHVQVGPFATKKDADAMRLRLQADGYNAIVK